jgi:hypothetical protein
MDVGGNDGAAAGDFAADKFRFDFFAFGDLGHLFGDNAFTGQVHLRHVATIFLVKGIRAGLFTFASFDPSVTQCHMSPKSAVQ